MNAQERIDKANDELNVAREEQERCHHKWGKPFAERRTRPVGTFDHYEGHGSDPEPVYTYHDEPYTVWVRVCAHCGLKQETESTEPVVTGHRPVFPS